MPQIGQGAVQSPFRVTILLGYRLDDPLPEAVELAKAAALDFQRSGLDVEVRADLATAQSLQREARRGCDLLIFYGHGSEDGRLTFCDDRYGFADLNATAELEAFWRSLPACFVFACYGDRCARSLPGAWVAFTQPILTTAPKGFLYAFTRALRDHTLAQAIVEARESCRLEMKSPFADVMTISAGGWPERTVAPDAPRLTRFSPALAGSYRTDFASVQIGDLTYPDHEPFVGRVEDLRRLLDLPSGAGDRPLQRVVWVHGGPGMGKSSLLRELATLVRDTAFREADEAVHLLHLYCFTHTAADKVSAALCERATDLYALPAVPRSPDELMRAIEQRRGPHVWILDDLTYVAVRPEQSEQAVALVAAFAASARARALPLLLVVSSRRPPVADFERLEVSALSSSEAVALAARVWRTGGRQGDSPQTLPFGAAQLFAAVDRSTAAFKRALLLATSQRLPFAEYAERLREWDARERSEQRDPTLRSIAFELGVLDEMEARDGFRYRRFLGILHRLLRRAAHFSQAELESWFGDDLVTGTASRAIGYRNGLGYLTRLGLLLPIADGGGEAFTLPPNQRWSMRMVEDASSILPQLVPVRGVSERLSLALELASLGELGAVGELLEMERDHLGDLPAPAAARAVFYSRFLQAELARAAGQLGVAVALLDKIVDSFDVHREALRGSLQAEEPLSMALVNKGVLLGELGRSREAIAIYDEVLSLFADRPEAALAPSVAMALVNKGVRLGALGRPEEEMAAYDEVVQRFASRPEAQLAGRVAKALVNKGMTLGALGRREEEITIYDDVVHRFGDRPEAQLAEQVANALVNKGMTLGALGRPEEEMTTYDDVVHRFGDRPEVQLAEQVAKALVNKGVRLGALGRPEREVISVFDDVVHRFGTRPEGPLAHQVAKALANKGVKLGELGRSTEAIAVYDDVVHRFADRPEAQLAEKVGQALASKGMALGALGRSAEAIDAFDEVIRLLGGRTEARLAEVVAQAALARALERMKVDPPIEVRSRELLALLDEYSRSPHAAVRQLAESVTALVAAEGLAPRPETSPG